MLLICTRLLIDCSTPFREHEILLVQDENMTSTVLVQTRGFQEHVARGAKRKYKLGLVGFIAETRAFILT
jgi:hypothetical protein